MSDRTQSGNSPAPGSGTAQGSTVTTTQTTTPAPGSPATTGQQGTPTTGDSWTPRIGIIALGVVALLCVIALIYLSAQPEPPGTAPQPAEAEQPTQTGPVAVEVANDTGALGLLGQIVGVLGTIAAAAIGGIAGFLTGARSTGTTEPQTSGTAAQQESG
jgi:hypothetical protein